MNTLVTPEIIFGYDLVEGRYIVNQEEASVVRMTFYVYVVCELSHQQIAFHFNRLGVQCSEERWTDELVDDHSDYDVSFFPAIGDRLGGRYAQTLCGQPER